ncbi:MAG: MFS transporter [bacterium]
MKTVTKIHQMMLLNVINVGIVVFWSVDGAFMTNYLTKRVNCFSPFGMTDFEASVVLNTGQLMIVLGLLFGYLSDRTRTRIGRRAPFILSGAVAAAVFYCVIPFLNDLALVVAVQVIVYFFVVWMSIPYYALVPDVTPPEKLSTCNAFFSLFGAVGTIAGYAVVGGILCDQCAYPSLYRYLPFGATGALLLLFALTTVAATREDTTAPPGLPVRVRAQTGAQTPRGEGFIRWFAGLVSDLRERRDLFWFMVFNFVLWMGLQGFVKFFTRFMDSDMGVPLDTAALALGVLPVVVMALAVPVGILGDRVSRKGLLMAGVLITMAAMVAGYFLIRPNARPAGAPAAVTGAPAAGGVSGFKAEYDYAECLAGSPDPCGGGSGDMLGKLGMLREEPLRTTALVLGAASAGLCVVFVLMAAIAPTLMPENKVGEFMGLLSATTGLGSAVGLIVSGALSTLLAATIHCRVIFIIGAACLAAASLVLLKVKIRNARDFVAQ